MRLKIKKQALGGIWTPDLYLTKVTQNLKDAESGKIHNLQKVELWGPNPPQGFVNWLAFKDYLSKQCNRNTAKVRLCYAKRFYHVLLNEDVHDLLAIES